MFASAVDQRSSIRFALASTICIALLLMGSVSPLVKVTAQGQGGRGIQRPQPGKPEGTWPDLEVVKRESQIRREPLPPIPSTVRSPKMPLEPWNGHTVGDPDARIGADQAVGQVRRAHARRRITPPPPLFDDQFIQNFFSWALLHAPNSNTNEPTYWNDQFRVAYTQGQTALRLAAIELGKTMFESAEYVARNRDNHWYVYDLYKTYLMRDPDSGGWAYWEAVVSSIGRENVRRGFEDSTEFATLISTIAPNGSFTANAGSLISARVDPHNEPGFGMIGRDATWTVPLLTLPGRSGLDLGLSLSYSSMVWTRSGPYLYFDEDNGFPSPGFRLGFPTVQRKVFDAQTARNSYLLLTANGQRVELRQVGASNIYDSFNSTYLRLTESEGTLLLQSTDGTRLSFTEVNGEYRCVEIKDRNGNYITVNYNNLGRITTISDTLNRVITFNYDGNANLLSITQAWNGQPSHQWVSFGWSAPTMQFSFSHPSLQGIVGVKNGNPVPVISQVVLNDTSYFTFEYTNSLQMSVLRNNFGAIERNATIFTYETSAGDVPRLLDSRVSAHNWSGLNGVPSQVITTYGVAGDGACVLTAPDGTVSKHYYGTGWQRGLVTLSEVWSGGVRQKWTTTAWTQDNTTVGYEVNPRVTETNTYDTGGNRRRVVIDYGPYAQYGLPYGVREFAGDGVTEIRQTWTDYNLAQAYLDRRIIGLVSYVHVSNVAQWQSKVSYEYDDPTRLQATPTAATQHDANYGASFTARGNVTAISSWDINDISNAAKKLTTYTGYYTTGTPSSSTDPAGHQSSIAYGDSFSDGVSRNTFAYPTTTTDAGSNSSYVQYNYDFGATTRTQLPPPADQLQGAIQVKSYNNLGQLERTTTTNNKAYTRFWYGPDYVASYQTVNSVADEFYSIHVVDGMDRVVGSANNHPGSTGGYRLVVTIYDQMGHAVARSNPGEIDSSWVPKGDEASGLYFTHQTYDWKGRPLVTTNQDGTTKSASYAGCGCAGDEVATLTDEVGRRIKVFSDAFGRQWKEEVLNWDGTSVYATTVSVFNVRDQLTNVKQYAGSAPVDSSSTNAAASCPNPSSTCQETLMTYDGYGRLQTKHVPEQNQGSTATFSYNSDNTLNTITDARGALKTYGYNSRHLPTSVVSTLSGSSIVSVTYGYDAAGNRTSMTHTVGGAAHDKTDYNYDELSRLVSETVHINAVQAYSPNYGNYTIGYAYNVANQLTSVVDPFNSPTTTTYDQSGRIAAVTGSWNGTNYTYVNDLRYRAWGAVKAWGGQTALVLYNSRMLPTHFGGSGMSIDYTYHDDGQLKTFKDLNDQVGDPHFVQFHYMSRAYSYDQAGRISNVGQIDSSVMAPFSISYGYDAFDNINSRSAQYALNSAQSDSTSYTNNRRSGWAYNAEGQVTSSADNSDPGGSSTRSWIYDAAGELGFVSEIRNGQTKTTALGYNGDGELIGEIFNGTTSDYMVRSTVLGTVLTKLTTSGAKDTTYVPANGLVAPMQKIDPFSSPQSYMIWVLRDPLGIQENNNGTPYAYDPSGNVINNVQPPVSGPPPYMAFYGSTYGGVSFNSFSLANNLAAGCNYHGAPTDCNSAMIATMGLAFAANLPGAHLDMALAEQQYSRYVAAMFAAAAQKKKQKKPPKLRDITWMEREAHKRIKKKGGTNPFGVGADENTPFHLDSIESLVTAALATDACIDFYSVVLAGVNNKDNPVLANGNLQSIFEAFLAQKNPLFRRKLPDNVGPANAYAVGVIGKGAYIYIGERDQPFQEKMDAFFTVGELFHLAGSKLPYTDEQLSNAIHYSKFGEDYEKKIDYRTNPFSDQYDPKDRNRVADFSYYFHHLQEQYCFTPKPRLTDY